jgi:beta-N-acetylhexosaminidase
MHAIAKRHGRGEDVKLAIAAGNDLALICHETGSAEAAARAIAELPHWMIEEARDRIDRFRRKKLHGPLVWSDAKWEKTIHDLTELAAEFQENDNTATHSPVAGY